MLSKSLPFPFSFTPEASQEVHAKTASFLHSETDIKNRILELSWIYHSVTNTIPHTYENWWSGHYFPISDSWEEFQVSYNLCAQGFYKQAFCSLRSMLETGLLSVYYNINDEGHKTVKNWLSSKDSPDAKTPTSKVIWKILRSNSEIKAFDSKHGLYERHQQLGYLHNYVHTKGQLFSNNLGLLKSNQQTFEETILRKWVASLEEVIILISTLHILKYPQSLVKYDWGSKFGMDIPSMGNLQSHEIERLERLLPEEYFLDLEQVAHNSGAVMELMSWVESLPDMTDEDIEDQYFSIQKLMIKGGCGFLYWEQQERKAYRDILSGSSPESKELFEKRIARLREWAEENDMMESRIEGLT